MDIGKILSDLTAERERIEQAILVLQGLAQGHKRRGRKPAWMKQATDGPAEPAKRRGRPPGSKDKSRRATRARNAIARFAKRYSMVALVISVMLSVFVVAVLPLPNRLLRKLFYVEIPIILILVVFIMLIAMFLAYYPVVLHRNALAYATGYIVFFLCKTTLMFIYNLHVGASGRVFSTILLYVTLGCIVFWTIFFSRAGEQRMTAVGSSWSAPERQQQVLDRLRELNDILLRSGPR